MQYIDRRAVLRGGAAAGGAVIAGYPGVSLAQDDLPTVALSVPSLEFTFFARMENAFEAARGDSIAQNSTFYDAQNNQAQQISDIETAVANDVAFLMVSAITAEGATPAVRDAIDAGIPVVAIDRNIANADVATYVASDNVALGRRSTELLLEFATARSEAETYGVVQLTGTPGASVTNDRAEGFREAVDASDALNALDSQTGQFATAEALAVMEDFVTNYGTDIDGVYAQNDLMALGAHRAVRGTELEGIPITGIDGTQAWVELFPDNEYYGTIAQLPEQMVATSIEMGTRALEDEDLPEFVPIEGLRVTQENAESYLQQYFGPGEPPVVNASNVTLGNETNVTAGNETGDNETVGNATVGNETLGNETDESAD